MDSHRRSRAQRRWSALALALLLLTSIAGLWAMVIRDDGQGLGAILIVTAAGVGAAASRLRPDGLARAMVGVAAMQILFAIGAASAPSVSADRAARLREITHAVGLTAGWLAAAFCFARAKVRP